MLRAAADFERSGTKKRRQDDRRSSAARLLLHRNSFPRAQHVEVSIAPVDINARPVHLRFVFQACLRFVILPFISASCGLPTVQVVYLQQQVHLSAVQRNLLLTLPGCRRFLSRPPSSQRTPDSNSKIKENLFHWITFSFLRLQRIYFLVWREFFLTSSVLQSISCNPLMLIIRWF